MADSYTDFGTGGADLTAEQITGVFDNLTLDYLSTTHFTITVTQVDGTQIEIANSNLTVATSPSLKITITGGITLPLTATDLVRVQRATPVGELQRTFADGSVLKASDLNTQNKQVLFGLQEQVDGGLGSLPIATDGMYDAGDRRIKNLGTATDSSHAVTKEYVDNVSLYGGAFGGSDPQYWSFTASGDDVDGANRAWTLSSPTPASATDNMYLIEVGGVIQSPSSYTVTESGGTYTLTIPGGATSIEVGTVVIARNFGVARNVIEQPFINLDDTTVNLIVRNYSASTTADIQQWQESDGTVLAKVAEDGDATFVDVNATGNASVTGTTNLVGNTTVNTDKVVINAANGNTTIDGTLGVGGLLSASESAAVTGNITATGNISAVSMVGTGNLYLDGEALPEGGLTVGTTETSANATIHGGLSVRGGAESGDGIISIKPSGSEGIRPYGWADASTAHKGRFSFSTNGPQMRYASGGDTAGYAALTVHSNYAKLVNGDLKIPLHAVYLLTAGGTTVKTLQHPTLSISDGDAGDDVELVYAADGKYTLTHGISGLATSKTVVNCTPIHDAAFPSNGTHSDIGKLGITVVKVTSTEIWIMTTNATNGYPMGGASRIAVEVWGY